MALQIEHTFYPETGCEEYARLSALASIDILDTSPEPVYNAITRLAADYFQADTVLLGFADESRVWIKSSWGEQIRELPRNGSIFDKVLAANGPVVVPDMRQLPGIVGVRTVVIFLRLQESQERLFLIVPHRPAQRTLI